MLVISDEMQSAGESMSIDLNPRILRFQIGSLEHRFEQERNYSILTKIQKFAFYLVSKQSPYSNWNLKNLVLWSNICSLQRQPRREQMCQYLRKHFNLDDVENLEIIKCLTQH